MPTISTAPATLVLPTRPPGNPKVLCIGEAPGADEVREGRPFVGPSGRLLRGQLAHAGIDPESVAYANLSLVRPPGNELRSFFDSGGHPNHQLIDGLIALKEFAASIQPNVVIALGNYPLKFLTNKGRWTNDGYTGIGDYRGSVLPGTALIGGAKVVPTYHPAAVLRQYPLLPILGVDLARAASQSGYAEIRNPRSASIVDPGEPDRSDWYNWLIGSAESQSPPINFGTDDAPEWTTVPSDPFLTVDIEYIGSKLLCVGFTRQGDVGVTFRTDSLEAIQFIRGILLRGVPLCFQNGMFDCSILEWHYDIPCVRYFAHDTMIAMHVAYTEFPKDLGFIGSIYTEEGVWYEEINADYWRRLKKLFETGAIAEAQAELAKMLPYNCGDVRVTHKAMVQLLADELREPDVAAAYRHEIGLVHALWDISKTGVRIDTSALATLRTKLESESTVIVGAIDKIAGRSINVKSPPQVAKYVYETLGVAQVGAKTPGGRWKMDDTTLADLQLKCKDDRQRNGIRLVREARERLDLISKFCDIELDDDGRMRCHYDPAKTLTGRLASRKFYPTGRGSNLQNIPRDDRVRAVFVPDRGRVFGYADLKSAESLVVAHITGDTEMLRLHSPEYLSGALDGHKYVASFLLDKPIERITKDERYLGKRVRHAGNYGMSWLKLQQLVNADAQKTGVSIDAAQAKRLIAKYRQLHPGLEVWWRDVESELRRTHTLRTLHGRKRVFYDRPESILPEAIAYAPQGTVAQTLNTGLLRCSAVFHDWWIDTDFSEYESALFTPFADDAQELRELDFQMLLQVHDAIGFQVPEKHLDRAVEILVTAMEIPLTVRRRGVAPYTFTIPVDVKVGYNWGEFDDKNPEKNPGGLKPYEPPSA